MSALSLRLSLYLTLLVKERERENRVQDRRAKGSNTYPRTHMHARRQTLISLYTRAIKTSPEKKEREREREPRILHTIHDTHTHTQTHADTCPDVGTVTRTGQ